MKQAQYRPVYSTLKNPNKKKTCTGFGDRWRIMLIAVFKVASHLVARGLSAAIQPQAQRLDKMKWICGRSLFEMYSLLAKAPG